MRRKANAPSTVEPTVNSRWQPRKKTVELRKLFGGMPSLAHHPDKGLPFHPSRSQVITWLMAHPDAGQLLFSAAKDAKAIEFDPATRKWYGCNRRPRHVR